jgi:hypothetical protein
MKTPSCVCVCVLCVHECCCLCVRCVEWGAVDHESILVFHAQRVYGEPRAELFSPIACALIPFDCACVCILVCVRLSPSGKSGSTIAGRTDFAESAEDEDIELQRALEISLQHSEGTAPPNVRIQSAPTYSRLFCITHTHTHSIAYAYLSHIPHTQTTHADRIRIFEHAAEEPRFERRINYKA